YSSRDPDTSNAVAIALDQAIQTGPAPRGYRDLFCDPMTWEFWLDPFTKKLAPRGEVGPEVASAILRPEILKNRSRGYSTAALRSELEDELQQLKSALPEAAKTTVSDVKISTEVLAPLAASADRSTMTIIFSESLVRYAFIQTVIAVEHDLRNVFTPEA